MARLNLSANLVSPPTPAPGYASIYFKTDNVLYIKDSSGVETAIGTASGITELTGDVTAVGPGVVPGTVNFVGGASAADVATSVNDTQAATDLNTPSTIVKRDASGDFAAGVITADLTGDVTGNLTGNVTGAASDNVLKAGDTMTGALIISVADVAALRVGTNTLVVDSVTGLVGINKLSPTEALDVVGNGQFTGTIVAFNLSGTNTGNIVLQPVGSTPSANGASLSGGTGQDLTLQPADGTHPGVLTAIAQNIGGVKNFLANVTVADTTQSTNKDTGSIVTEGGLGVEKNINAGGNIAAVGTVTGSNLSGSSSGTNTGDVTVTDSNSIDLTLVGQDVKADLKLSADPADAGYVKATNSIHADGLHTEIQYGTPVQVGTSNFIGSGSGKVADADHVHAHGNQSVTTLHAAATPLANGFMPSTDKAKLDTISATLATNAQILISDGTTYNPKSVSGDATITNLGVVTVSSSVNFSGTLAGDVTGTQGATVIATGAVTDTKASLANKPAVTVVATTNQALTGTPTIDSQTTTANQSIVLATAQTTGSENGPWVVQTGAWTRPTWYPNGGTTQAFQFITTFVRLGTVYQGSVWRMTTSGAIIIGTTTTTWVVTPTSGNYKSPYVVGPQTGSSEVDLVFANTNRGTLGWSPGSNFSILLPIAQGANGTFLVNDGTGQLSWTNPNVNIDGGTANSVYTLSQTIDGGTP